MRPLIILVVFFLIACEKNIDKALDESDLKLVFTKNTSTFKALKKMIIIDSRSMEIFEVGEDRIGGYSLHENGWAKKYGTFVLLNDVLNEYNISQVRFDKYLSLLSKTGASSVSIYEGRVSFTVLSLGFVFGGCLSTIMSNPLPVALEKPDWAQIFYKVELKDNWFGVTYCD